MNKFPFDFVARRQYGESVEETQFLVDEDLAFETEPPFKLLDLWRSKRDGERFPCRSDFDWPELKPFFGWICIAEVLPSRKDLRFRLIGSGIAEVAGRDVTGRLVSEAMPPTTLEIYLDLIDRPRPLRTHGTVQWRDKEYIRHETLVLPLADNGVDVDQFMLVMSFMQ